MARPLDDVGITATTAVVESAVDERASTLTAARAELAALERRVLLREARLRGIALQLGRTREALAARVSGAGTAAVGFDDSTRVQRLAALARFALVRCGLDSDGAARLVALSSSARLPTVVIDFAQEFDDEVARQSAQYARSVALEVHARAAVVNGDAGGTSAGVLAALRAEPDSGIVDGQDDTECASTGCGSDGFSLLSLVTSSSGSYDCPPPLAAPIGITSRVPVAPVVLHVMPPPLIVSARELDNLMSFLGPRSQALVLARVSLEAAPATPALVLRASLDEIAAVGESATSAEFA